MGWGVLFFLFLEWETFRSQNLFSMGSFSLLNISLELESRSLVIYSNNTVLLNVCFLSLYLDALQSS